MEVLLNETVSLVSETSPLANWYRFSRIYFFGEELWSFELKNFDRFSARISFSFFFFDLAIS